MTLLAQLHSALIMYPCTVLYSYDAGVVAKAFDRAMDIPRASAFALKVKKQRDPLDVPLSCGTGSHCVYGSTF